MHCMGHCMSIHTLIFVLLHAIYNNAQSTIGTILLIVSMASIERWSCDAAVTVIFTYLKRYRFQDDDYMLHD